MTLERARRLVAGKWKYVTADESGGGGAQPGTIQVVERTFAQVAGGGHVYTATVDLPNDSTLLAVALRIFADWDGGADLTWIAGDESASDNLMTGAIFGYEGEQDVWCVDAGERGDVWLSISRGALCATGTRYPTGQTITGSTTDTIGGTGTAVMRFYYYVAPDTEAAVVTDAP